MKVKATYTEEALGLSSADPEVHTKFIATKFLREAKTEEQEEEAQKLLAEEMESVSLEEYIDKSTTVFPRDADGIPFLWDYQVRGFLKSWFQMKTEFEDLLIKAEKKEVKFSKWTYRRVVDNFIFVKPRRIMLHLPEGTKVGTCTRPLRVVTMRGERVALATSETVPAGTWFEFEILVRHSVLEQFLPDMLDYGALKGISQWRNSGKGTFIWEEVSEEIGKELRRE